MNYNSPSITLELVKRYIQAMPCGEYRIVLRHRYKEEKGIKTIAVNYRKKVLLKQATINFLKMKNAQGFHIYCRPKSWRYILIDDLSREQLKPLAEIKPCLLVETSPNNYQAWIKLSKIPESREQALCICQEIALKFNADISSAEPDHLGRLVGFINCKPQYQKDGKYPFVILHKYKERISSFIQSNDFKAQVKDQVKHRRTKEGYSQSEIDFAVACQMLREGKAYNEIYMKIKSQYNGFKHGSDYIDRTIANASIATKIPPVKL